MADATRTAAAERAHALPTRGAPKTRQAATGDVWLMRAVTGLVALFLLVSVVLPLTTVVARSLQDAKGTWVGLANYVQYFQTPSLAVSFGNSLVMAGLTTVIAVSLGFVFAYALQRTTMPGKGVFRVIGMLPLYAPPLVLAIALIYLFGNKGLVTTGLFGRLPGVDINLYGLTGILMAEVLYCFPQALLICATAFAVSDARLYEAADVLRASPLRTFWTVTLPGVKFGLMSAAFVCFTLAFTDFGAPKVVGGSYNVLATDIYKQVIGQQNFVMGATISILILVPTVLAFLLDRLAQRRQVALLSARAVPLEPKPHPWIDRSMWVFCALVSVAIVLVLGSALIASLATAWPYNLTPTLRHYSFRGVGASYADYWNSVRMALVTAVAGTLIVFLGAYMVEKGRTSPALRNAIYFLSVLPVALPGLVLGLAYIFFFNAPVFDVAGVRIPNLLSGLYGTLAILVLSNVVHFYTVSFLTATTALKQIDAEVENAAASLRAPFYRTMLRVTAPICLPAMLEIGMYYFVNSMVTVSALIFLYTPRTRPASIAVVNMDDAGNTAAAAAMSMLIVGTSILARLVYGALTAGVARRSQAWRKRQA